MRRQAFSIAALSLGLTGLALAAERPDIAAGTDYEAASAALTRAGYKPTAQPAGRAVCTTRGSLCEAYPEMRDCGPGETPICLFQWTSADGRMAAYVEARGASAKALRVTRAYEIAVGGSPYPLGTSGL